MVSDSQSFVLMVGYASNTVCFLDEISKIKTMFDKIINCLEYLRNNYSIISYILDFLHTFRWFLKSFMVVARSETKIYWYLKIKLLSSKPLIKSFYNVRTFFKTIDNSLHLFCKRTVQIRQKKPEIEEYQ